MPHDERLPQIQARLDKLARAAFQFWRAHGPDREQGGFYGTLDRHGTLRFIETSLADPADGEWFWNVRPDGSFGDKGDIKGSAWKASYHTLRALVFTGDWIAAARAR